MPNWLGAIDIGPLRDSAYSQRDPHLAAQAAGQLVQGQRALHLEDGADLQVILQVFADAGHGHELASMPRDRESGRDGRCRTVPAVSG